MGNGAVCSPPAVGDVCNVKRHFRILGSDSALPDFVPSHRMIPCTPLLPSTVYLSGDGQAPEGGTAGERGGAVPGQQGQAPVPGRHMPAQGCPSLIGRFEGSSGPWDMRGLSVPWMGFFWRG